MDLLGQFQYFSGLDALAIACLLISWVGLGYLIEIPPASRPSTASLMSEYRRHWMVQMITRQPRIFDASILATLRQGTTFFGSACLIAIGTGLAAIGNAERLQGVAEDLDLHAPEIIWEVKILLSLFVITSAFMNFIWSNRLFGYSGVMMASVPNDTEAPEALPRAHKAAELNIAAAKSFNRGLRAVYFALGSLGWLLGPEALLVTTALTIMTLVRREFFSRSRDVILRPES
nr:DUF599 domain-containing protein [uncultured Celeribacter sp.]